MVVYKKDIELFFGKFFNYDDLVNDRIEGFKLVEFDKEIRMLWWEIFGINFLEFGVMYRGKLVNGCLFFVFSDVIDKYSVKIV